MNVGEIITLLGIFVATLNKGYGMDDRELFSQSLEQSRGRLGISRFRIGEGVINHEKENGVWNRCFDHPTYPQSSVKEFCLESTFLSFLPCVGYSHDDTSV